MRDAIVIASAARLSLAIAEHHPEIVVSLVGRGEAPAFRDPAFRHVHLECYDIPQDRGHRRAPGVFHVSRLIEVAEAWTGARPLLVHCREGMSRAPAAAFIVACHLSAEDEGAIGGRLSALASWHRPHAGFVDAADAVLRRDGRMVEAMLLMHVSAHGSGGKPAGAAPRVMALGPRRKPVGGHGASEQKGMFAPPIASVGRLQSPARGMSGAAEDSLGTVCGSSATAMAEARPLSLTAS